MAPKQITPSQITPSQMLAKSAMNRHEKRQDEANRLDGLGHDWVAPNWVAEIGLAVASRRDFADFRQDHQPPLDQSGLMYRRADHIHWRQFSVKCVA